MIPLSLKTIFCIGILALSLGLVWHIEANAQAWPNEPAGSRVISDWSWNALSGAGWRDDGGNRRIVQDSTAPLSAASVLESKRDPNAYGGSNEALDFTTSNELYVGFWWKPSSPFTGWATLQNKISIVKSATGGHTYVLMNSSQRGGPFALAIQLDYGSVGNSHLGNGWGDSLGPWNLYANQGDSGVALGVWHRIELYIKKSTTSTSQDGILRWWMDGSPQGNYTNVNYPAGFVNVGLTPIWDSPDNIPFPEYHWYDHVKVSIPSGGGGAPNGDTSPPASPVNLRVN